ncbi:MAG: hypothetical protein IK099_04325 [Clostridia bacterium]|nr:hypothetical protein [Clostridia bacterium]
MVFSAVFAIVSAMVGAGFASGREIITFFSRYGPLSWLLVIWAAIMMGWLIHAYLSIASDGSNPFFRFVGKPVMLLMFAAAGGAMTAAAGEVAALTLPVFHARIIGCLLTLAAGIVISRKTVKALGMIGRILVPLMLVAFFFCFRLSAKSSCDAPAAIPSVWFALFQLLGYCGLNVTLSSGVIREAGTQCKDCRKLVVWTGILIGMLLCAGNAAMVSHAAAMENEPLPVVMLLRNYQKTGYCLSASVLYLAVFSTLTAILRAMRELFPQGMKHPGAWSGLMCAVFSLLGFDLLVQYAYAALGWIGILLIFWKKHIRHGTKQKDVSSIGRTPMKKEMTE